MSEAILIEKELDVLTNPSAAWTKSPNDSTQNEDDGTQSFASSDEKIEQ